MSEAVEFGIKKIKVKDDYYLCKSDLIFMIARVKGMSESEETKNNIQVIMEMVAGV